jgi:fumarate reductase flavoprotein subunit
LFVAGEDASGMHGANRLGGNGVANSTVFGGVAGDVMSSYAASAGPHQDPDETIIEAEISRALHPFSKKPGNVNSLREDLMDIMWDNVGVMRTAEGIKRGIGQIRQLKAELLETGVGEFDTIFNVTWNDWLNLRSLAETSEMIAQAALSRENSRGAHYREDFPQAGELDDSCFTLARSSADGISVKQDAVVFSIIRPGESLIEGYHESGS